MGVIITNTAIFVILRHRSPWCIVIQSILFPSRRLERGGFRNPSTYGALHSTACCSFFTRTRDVHDRFRRGTDFGGYVMQIDNPE